VPRHCRAHRPFRRQDLTNHLGQHHWDS
jgi:hypothetical protein